VHKTVCSAECSTPPSAPPPHTWNATILGPQAHSQRCALPKRCATVRACVPARPTPAHNKARACARVQFRMPRTDSTSRLTRERVHLFGGRGEGRSACSAPLGLGVGATTRSPLIMLCRWVQTRQPRRSRRRRRPTSSAALSVAGGKRARTRACRTRARTRIRHRQGASTV